MSSTGQVEPKKVNLRKLYNLIAKTRDKSLITSEQNVIGRNILHYACVMVTFRFYDSGQVADFILDNAPDPNSLILAKDTHDQTPAQLMLFHSDPRNQPVHQLIRRMLDIAPKIAEIVDEKGFSPLHLAVYHEDFEMCKTLVDVHPEAIGIQSKTGDTPLHLTQVICTDYQKAANILELLVKKMPNKDSVFIKNSDGLSIFDSYMHGLTPRPKHPLSHNSYENIERLLERAKPVIHILYAIWGIDYVSPNMPPEMDAALVKYKPSKEEAAVFHDSLFSK
jgi:ankyrin repeat protein